MNLLFPYENINTTTLTEDAYTHLAIEELVDLIAVTTEEKELLRKTLSVIPCDANTAIYRQEILRDFMNEATLCDELGEVLKSLDVLKEYRNHSRFTTQKKASLWDLIDYMEEMGVYIEIVEGLNTFFQTHEITSQGLIDIRELLKEVIDTDSIEELKGIVQGLRTEISTLKSLLVGINLTPELRPEEIRVLQYNTEPYQSQFTKTSWALSLAARRKYQYQVPSQFMKYVCDDMEKELSKNVQRYKAQLKQYVNFKGYFLLDICNDLRVMLMMAKFGRKLKESGYTICFPNIKGNADTVEIKGIYNVRLTARKVQNIVKNDFVFSPQEKIFILTGPNRGGKTMLTQALGINALFAAQGWFVMADSYQGYLFENILTHFPADENLTLDLGRLGEEATRVQKIVKAANEKTMVLLNETYSSTSSQDGLYLAQDLVHILKHKAIPTVFNTHIHELARSTAEMNAWEGESEIVSLTMEIKDNVNTYRVLRSQPDSSSFAKNIALKYGVTYEQLLNES